jgi:N-methylhydantoinase A
MVYFGERRPCPLYDRARLEAGMQIVGPAIIEQLDSTTLVFPGQRAEVQEYGNLVIRGA